MPRQSAALVVIPKFVMNLFANGGRTLPIPGGAFTFTTQASDAEITVNKELTVDASGGSDVYYKGSGVIRNVRSSGSSSVKKRG